VQDMTLHWRSSLNFVKQRCLRTIIAVPKSLMQITAHLRLEKLNVDEGVVFFHSHVDDKAWLWCCCTTSGQRKPFSVKSTPHLGRIADFIRVVHQLYASPRAHAL
jgi:hypothetical protein